MEVFGIITISLAFIPFIVALVAEVQYRLKSKSHKDQVRMPPSFTEASMIMERARSIHDGSAD